MTHYNYPQHSGYPTVPMAPRNGLGIASLVLGIIGIAFSWIPIVGFIGFVLGVLGVTFGAVGISRSNRGVATNRGVAIAGLATSCFAIVLSTVVFFSFATFVAESPKVTAVPDGSQGLNAAAPAAPAQERTAFRIGETASVDGLEITVEKLVSAKGTLGDNLMCSMVRIVNNSGEPQDFNELFDWDVQDPEGVRHTPTTFADKVLGSGSLAPGGKVAGNICAEASGTGEYLFIYDPMLASHPPLTWAGTR